MFQIPAVVSEVSWPMRRMVRLGLGGLVVDKLRLSASLLLVLLFWGDGEEEETWR